MNTSDASNGRPEYEDVDDMEDPDQYIEEGEGDENEKPTEAEGNVWFC